MEARTCDGGRVLMRAIGEEVEAQVDVVCSCECQNYAVSYMTDLTFLKFQNYLK